MYTREGQQGRYTIWICVAHKPVLLQYSPDHEEPVIGTRDMRVHAGTFRASIQQLAVNERLCPVAEQPVDDEDGGDGIQGEYVTLADVKVGPSESQKACVYLQDAWLRYGGEPPDDDYVYKTFPSR